MSELLDAQKMARQILADQCRLDLIFIDDALKIGPSACYREKLIPKKSGKMRVIHEPCREYKIIQRCLLQFLYQWPLDNHMYGFAPRKNPVLNARAHLGGVVPRWMATLDLKDAFPSVIREMLSALYKSLFYSESCLIFAGISAEDKTAVIEEFIELLITFTLHDGCLPQGAPTSPYLLNLVLLDRGVIKCINDACSIRIKPFSWTIYADDITISSENDKIGRKFINWLIADIKDCGFVVNPEKTRRSSKKYKAHKITGVVLTQNQKREYGSTFPKATLPQKTLKHWRGLLYRVSRILKYDCRQPDREKDGVSVDMIVGFIGWARFVFMEDKNFPPSIRLPIAQFEREWQRFKKKKVLYQE